MLRWMLAWEPWDKQELWIAPAVPNKWLRSGFSAHHVLTSWGNLTIDEREAGKGLTMDVTLSTPHPGLTVYFPVRLVQTGNAPKVTVERTNNWEWDYET